MSANVSVGRLLNGDLNHDSLMKITLIADKETVKNHIK